MACMTTSQRRSTLTEALPSPSVVDDVDDALSDPFALRVVAREAIDEEGDVLVHSGSKTLLVSSKILGLASPVFKVMFKSRFREGTTARSPQQPLELRLSDDDPDALALLFRIWHFAPERKHFRPDVDLQLELAQLTDKYDCSSSIYMESKYWLRALLGQTKTDVDADVDVYWKSATAAFLWGHDEELATSTAKVALLSSAEKLDAHKMYSCLPGGFKQRLQQLRKQVLSKMISEVEAALDYLRSERGAFTTNLAVCNHCGQQDSLVYSRCQRQQCRKDDRRRHYCTGEVRVALLLNALSSAGMWPFTDRLEESAVLFSTKANLLPMAFSLQQHGCDGDTKCPLLHIGARVDEKVNAVVAQCRGISLQSLSEGDDRE